MNNETFRLVGEVQCIGDLIHMKKKSRPDLYKKVVTIVTADGQKLYVDVINSRLKDLEKGIDVSTIVEVHYSFKGSERDGKKYNNIYCNSIKRI